jgi:hypothetical protein
MSGAARAWPWKQVYEVALEFVCFDRHRRLFRSIACLLTSSRGMNISSASACTNLSSAHSSSTSAALMVFGDELLWSAILTVGRHGVAKKLVVDRGQHVSHLPASCCAFSVLAASDRTVVAVPMSHLTGVIALVTAMVRAAAAQIAKAFVQPTGAISIG